MKLKAPYTLTLTVFLFAMVALAVTGCSSKSSGGLGPDGTDGFGADGTFSDEDLAMAERKWGDGNIPQAQLGGQYGADGQGNGPFQDIRFGYDSSAIPPEYIKQLEEDSKILVNDSSLKVEIEGHCDNRGTNEYNLALGKSRAKRVANYLVNLGVNPSQLSTITYGEEIPLDPSESESAFGVNRRAHFAIFRDRASLGGGSVGKSGVGKSGVGKSSVGENSGSEYGGGETSGSSDSPGENSGRIY